MTTKLVLALPQPSVPFSVDTNASDGQLGAALFQTHVDGERKHIGFWSPSLNKHEKNYSHGKGMPSGFLGTTNFETKSARVPFTVSFDHNALPWLIEIIESKGRLMRWSPRLGEFDFQIQYKKGIKNPQADALSCILFLVPTTVDFNDDFPQLNVSEPNEDEEILMLIDDLEEEKQLLSATHPGVDLPLVPFTVIELLWEQSYNPVCLDLCSCLNWGRYCHLCLMKTELFSSSPQRYPQIYQAVAF